MTELEQDLYKFIPASGRYFRDVWARYAAIDEREVRQALARMVAAGILKTAGCDIRPMYVRLIGRKAFLKKHQENTRANEPDPTTAIVVAAHGEEPAAGGAGQLPAAVGGIGRDASPERTPARRQRRFGSRGRHAAGAPAVRRQRPGAAPSGLVDTLGAALFDQ